MAVLVSVQAGRAANYPVPGQEDKTWRSAIVKTGLEGPVQVGPLGVAGDQQADKRNHGGPFRALNVYPSEHYDHWRAQPGLDTMTGGAFGENFTTRGLLEDDVCIGDVYQVGEVLVEVTQPRGPCFKLNRRWLTEELQERATASGRVGWYLRVMRPGLVQAGSAITRVERHAPEWSIARVWALYRDPSDADALRALVQAQGLSPDLKAHFEKKLRG